ncbi:hypothetical protein CHUAL_009609 [Chamberlinius hualienensis]
MARTVCFYYDNRTAKVVVELKNKPAADQSCLKTIIETLLLRRTKDQMGTSGKPLLEILSKDERDIYDELLLRSHDLFPDMAKVLVLLQHMQQCCCHLSLLNLEAAISADSLDDLIKQFESFSLAKSNSSNSTKLNKSNWSIKR